jgi:DNA polymerase III epsilon subunit family exonuclease
MSSLDELILIAFDVETTGLSAISCRLVELSAVKFVIELDGSARVLNTFTTLINPEQPIPPEVTRLHGITDEMVADAPLVKSVLESFYEFIAEPNAVLLAHNASFDVEFIRINARRLGKGLPTVPVVDTLGLSQAMVTGSANFKLKTLSEHFGFAGSTYHRALDDSFYVQKLFIKLVELGRLQNFKQIAEKGAVLSFAEEGSFSDQISENLKPLVATLETAIAANQSLKLKYGGEFVSTRVIEPAALISSRGALYLSAYCRKARAERTFRVDRILELSPQA